MKEFMNITPYILYPLIASLLLLALVEHISVRDSTFVIKYFKWLRKLWWPLIKKKLIRISNPLVAYPLMIQLTFDKSYRQAYVEGGVDKLIEKVVAFQKKLADDLTEAFLHPEKVLEKRRKEREEQREQYKKKYPNSKLPLYMHEEIDHLEKNN